LTSDAIFLTLGSILPNAPRPDSFLRLPSRSVENIHPERVTSADPKKPGRVRLACALLKPRSLGESSHPQVGPPARRGRCAGEMVHDPGPAPPDSLMLAHRTCLKTWGQFLPPPWWPSVLQREGLDAELRAVLEVQRRRPMPCRSRSGPSSPGSSGGPATPVRSRTSSRAGGERGRTPLEARRAVFDSIEGWYNPRRHHSALGYESPLHYEQAAVTTQEVTVGEKPRAVRPPRSTIAQGGAIWVSPKTDLHAHLVTRDKP